MFNSQFCLKFLFVTVFFPTLPAVPELSYAQPSTKKAYAVTINNDQPEWGKDTKIRIKLVKTLGGLEEEDRNFLFYNPSDIKISPRGNIYVLDTGNFRILKFDKSGEYLSTIGRQGDGPGEFSKPVSFEINKTGNIYVSNIPRRMQILDHTGKEVCRFRPGLLVENFCITDNSNILARGMILDREFYTNSDPDKKRSFDLFHLFDTEGNLIKKFHSTGEIPIHMTKFFKASGSFRAESVLDAKDNIYLTYRNLNKIEKYSSDGNLLFRSHRKLGYPAEKNLIKQDVKKIPLISKDICLDSKNRIWVLNLKRQAREDEKLKVNSVPKLARELQNSKNAGAGDIDIKKKNSSSQDTKISTKTDMYQIEIFDNNGTLLTYFPLKHYCDAITVADGRMLIVDKYRTMSVYIYNITERQ